MAPSDGGGAIASEVVVAGEPLPSEVAPAALELEAAARLFEAPEPAVTLGLTLGELGETVGDMVVGAAAGVRTSVSPPGVGSATVVRAVESVEVAVVVVGAETKVSGAGAAWVTVVVARELVVVVVELVLAGWIVELEVVGWIGWLDAPLETAWGELEGAEVVGGLGSVAEGGPGSVAEGGPGSVAEPESLAAVEGSDGAVDVSVGVPGVGGTLGSVEVVVGVSSASLAGAVEGVADGAVTVESVSTCGLVPLVRPVAGLVVWEGAAAAGGAGLGGPPVVVATTEADTDGCGSGDVSAGLVVGIAGDGGATSVTTGAVARAFARASADPGAAPWCR